MALAGNSFGDWRIGHHYRPSCPVALQAHNLIERQRDQNPRARVGKSFRAGKRDNLAAKSAPQAEHSWQRIFDNFGDIAASYADGSGGQGEGRSARARNSRGVIGWSDRRRQRVSGGWGPNDENTKAVKKAVTALLHEAFDTIEQEEDAKMRRLIAQMKDFEGTSETTNRRTRRKR